LILTVRVRLIGYSTNLQCVVASKIANYMATVRSAPMILPPRTGPEKGHLDPGSAASSTVTR